MRNQISSPGNIRSMNSIYTDFTLTLVRETKSELRCSTYQIEFTFYRFSALTGTSYTELIGIGFL